MRERRGFVCIFMVMYTLFFMSGCSGGISQEDYDLLLSQNKRLSIELEEERETVDTKVTGAFVATLRHVIPDYTLDNTTPQIAILTEFQSAPFLLHIGEEMAAKLEAGKTYYFEVEDTPIGEIPIMEFEKEYYSIEQGIYPLIIKSVREAKESEGGLNSPQIRYEKIQNRVDDQ